MHWLSKWYEGEFKIHDNDPASSVVFIGGGYQRHWTANAAHVAVDFWLVHWKYLITTTIALAAVIIAYKRLG